MSNNRVLNSLSKDLIVIEDENNPKTSKIDNIWPSTILDQVFDNLSPTNKSLRDIIKDLKQEIITGGKGNIIFPVTSVNGMTEDVIISAKDIGLGRVDNTRDIDKPLSTPQKNAIMDILSTYDFNVNLDDLYSHITDTNNPHSVKLEQINTNGVLDDLIESHIASHNLSTHNTVHMDIRRSLSKIWNIVDDLNNNIESRIGNVLDSMDNHLKDELSHLNLFNMKENISNKIETFSTTSNVNHKNYPTTKAVVDFVNSKLIEFKGNLPNVEDWITDIIVVDSRDKLPNPTIRYFRKAYFIRNGNTSHDEIAICRENPDGLSYSWDISQMGAISKFDEKYFVDTDNGLSLNMGSVLDAMVSENGMLDTSLSEVLKDYYTKNDIDEFEFVTHIKILPGTMDGTIRYYINDDMTTMSDDVKIPGLKRLAYLEWITEDQLWDECIHERHILSKSIAKRHLQDRIIDIDKICCKYGYLIGNTMNNESNDAHEISLMQLADFLRPLIGGWPDPNIPGGNPWEDTFSEQLMHHHLWTPNVEYPFNDHSYGIRFTGEISVLPNIDIKVLLSDKLKLGEYQIIDAGGTWMYQSDPKEWTILGGSNITGHTFATVNMTEIGLYLETISIGDRYKAPYDIWVKYIKPDELNQVLNPK